MLTDPAVVDFTSWLASIVTPGTSAGRTNVAVDVGTVTGVPPSVRLATFTDPVAPVASAVQLDVTVAVRTAVRTARLSTVAELVTCSAAVPTLVAAVLTVAVADVTTVCVGSVSRFDDWAAPEAGSVTDGVGGTIGVLGPVTDIPYALPVAVSAVAAPADAARDTPEPATAPSAASPAIDPRRAVNRAEGSMRLIFYSFLCAGTIPAVAASFRTVYLHNEGNAGYHTGRRPIFGKNDVSTHPFCNPHVGRMDDNHRRHDGQPDVGPMLGPPAGPTTTTSTASPQAGGPGRRRRAPTVADDRSRRRVSRSRRFMTSPPLIGDRRAPAKEGEAVGPLHSRAIPIHRS